MPKKQPKTVGRHLAITPQKRNKIVRLVEQGNYAKTVCQAVGISEPTFYSYINQGEEAEKRGDFNNPFFKFFKLIKEARAKAELKHVANIDINSEHDTSLSKWWLERTNPQDWGKKEYLSQDINMKSLPPAEIIFEVVDGKTSKDKGNKGIPEDIPE